MPGPERADPIDPQLASLRASISDLAHEIDVNKTKTGAAIGGGVFTLLLAVGADYDLMAGKAAAWSMVGISRENLTLIAIALTVIGLSLLSIGIVRIRRRDTALDTRLDQMEQDYARLLDAKEQTEVH
jgi:hypothetical protein